MLLSLLALAQQLPPAQQAELDKAQAELKKLMDPDHMARLLDEQISEARKNGATPAQIRELEQLKLDTIRQLRAEQATSGRATSDPSAANQTGKDLSNPDGTMLALLKNQFSKPDSVLPPTIYDELPGRYSPIPMVFRFYAESKLSPDQFPAFMNAKFGITIRQTGEYSLGGQQTIRYEQIHEGYPIRLSQYSITVDKEGHIVRANGDLFVSKAKASALPSVSSLLTKLRVATKLPGLKLAQTTQTDSLPVPYAEPRSPTWVHPDLDPTNPTLVLTQPFTVVTQESSRCWYLDAATGVVIATEQYTRNCLGTTGPGPVKKIVETFHHKKRPVGVSESTYDKKRMFYLADSTEIPAVVIISPRYTIIPEFTLDTLLADNALRLRGDFDALYGFRQAASYFKRLGLTSYDNAGSPIEAITYSQANANWDSHKRRFHFGVDNHIPITTLQIIAHEFTHAVNHYANGLIYQGESGALDETIADIFGTIIEHQTLGGNWILGDEIWPGGIRDLANPGAKGNPDTYEEKPWASTSSPGDHGGVHTNSAVGNKWFYLLIKGGKGQNARKHPFDVYPTLGYERVARLLLATLPRLTPRSGYEDFCRETIASAEQLFGTCNDYTQAVKRAWYAVGVLDDPPPVCKPGWTMDLVLKSGTERLTWKLYVKGDSVISVYRSPESVVKTFSSRNSVTMTIVVQDEEGVHAHPFPKDMAGFWQQENDKIAGMKDEAMSAALAEARTKLNDPDLTPERRAQLKVGITQITDIQEKARKARAETQKGASDSKVTSQPTSEMEFWKSRRERREFDKKYIKSTTTYEGKYLTRNYVVDGVNWWSTPAIPLRMSDICLMIPLAPISAMRSGIDYWLRGFPIRYLNRMQVQNIRESAPANFDTLFSTAPVFN